MFFENSRGPLFLFCLLLVFCGAPASAQKVAFRIDYVQDYWLTNVQRAIMDVFIDSNTHLTVGILGNKFGADIDYLYWMRDQTVRNNNTRLEIACNGWNDEDFTQFSVEEQTTMLDSCTENLERLLWVPPIKIFIPPAGKYNNNTLTAMRNNNMTHISSFTHIDLSPYPVSGQSIYRFPSGVGLGDEGGLSPALFAFTELSVYIDRNGFSVVYLDIPAFARRSGGQPIDSVDSTMITQLRTLLTMVRNADYSIVPLSKINTDAPTTKEPVDYTDIYSCNCVAFRLDDIQDWWLNSIQRSLITAFSDNQAGVTLGIIANQYGEDTQLVNFVRVRAANTSMVEISTHGYEHEDFSELDEATAISKLNQSITRIQTTTGVTPKTLVLPFNAFNNATISAMKSVGITAYSSSIQQDPPLYDMNHPDLWRFPTGAQTSEPEIYDYYQYVPASKVWKNIQKQLDRDGFSVIMVHPQEFSTRNRDNTYTQTLNQTSLNDFVGLLQTIKNAGLKIVPISAISSNLAPIGGGPMPSASPSPAAPTPSSSATPSASAAPSTSAVPSPSPSASTLPSASTQPSTSPAAPSPSAVPSKEPSSSPAASRNPSSSPAVSVQPSPSSSVGDVESSSLKLQPVGGFSIAILVVAAILAAQ